MRDQSGFNRRGEIMLARRQVYFTADGLFSSGSIFSGR